MPQVFTKDMSLPERLEATEKASETKLKNATTKLRAANEALLAVLDAADKATSEARATLDAEGTVAAAEALAQVESTHAALISRAKRIKRAAESELRNVKITAPVERAALVEGWYGGIHQRDPSIVATLADARFRLLEEDVQAKKLGAKAVPSKVIEQLTETALSQKLAGIREWLAWENKVHERCASQIDRAIEAGKERRGEIIRRRSQAVPIGLVNRAFFALGKGRDAADVRARMGISEEDATDLREAWRAANTKADAEQAEAEAKEALRLKVEILEIQAAAGIPAPKGTRPENLDAWREALGIRLPVQTVGSEPEPIDLAPVQNDAERAAADHTVACDLVPAGAGVWPVGA